MMADNDKPVTQAELDKALIEVYAFILDQEQEKDIIIRTLMDNITDLSRTISLLVRYIIWTITL